MTWHTGMLVGDYTYSCIFAANGIPTVMEWCDDDTGVVADFRRREQAKLMSTIG